MTKVLKYFDINGLAEAIRYILLSTDQKFEDVRYNMNEWPIKEVKDALPYGKLPVLEENGRVLNQSLAIARYVAVNTELLPSDPWQQAVLDAAALTFYDFHKNVYEIILAKTPEDKEKARKTFFDEMLPFYFSRFEEHLKKNNGYFGGKLSWADFVFIGIIEIANLMLKTEIQKGYPTVSKLVNEIQSIPQIKEYTRTRKPYDTSKWD